MHEIIDAVDARLIDDNHSHTPKRPFNISVEDDGTPGDFPFQITPIAAAEQPPLPPDAGVVETAAATAPGEKAAKPAKEAREPSKPKPQQAGLSFTEKHRLEELPGVIARLEAEIGKLEQLLADPELFTREPVKFRKATEALTERQDKLSAAEEEWLALEEKAEAAG